MAKMTLATMCGGGVQERIDHALAKISDNILDLNTDAKKKRTLTVSISFVPNEDDREDVTVDVSTTYKLAPEMPLKTQLYINKDFKNGNVTLTEHAKGQIKGQLTLDDMGMSMTPAEVDEAEREEKFDPETGEIIEKEPQKVINLREAIGE